MRIASECLGKQLVLRTPRRRAIGNHAGDLLPGEDSQSFLAVRNRQDLVAAVSQMGFDVLANGRVMIHDEDAVRHTRCILLPR